MRGGNHDLLRVSAAGEQRADPVADLPPGHSLADVGDHTGTLESEDLAGSGRWWVQASTLQQVGSVDRGGGNIEENLSGTELRVRLFDPLENFGPTGFGGDDCVHVDDVIVTGSGYGNDSRTCSPRNTWR